MILPYDERIKDRDADADPVATSDLVKRIEREILRLRGAKDQRPYPLTIRVPEPRPPGTAIANALERFRHAGWDTSGSDDRWIRIRPSPPVSEGQVDDLSQAIVDNDRFSGVVTLSGREKAYLTSAMAEMYMRGLYNGPGNRREMAQRVSRKTLGPLRFVGNHNAYDPALTPSDPASPRASAPAAGDDSDDRQGLSVSHVSHVIHTTQGEFRAYHAWILAHEAPDVEGAWVAHCPEFDVLSQGADPFGAIELAQEAVLATIHDDVERGYDPASRRTPDCDDWIGIAHALSEGVRCDPPQGYAPETERPVREIAKSIVILHDRAKGECSVKIGSYLAWMRESCSSS